MNTSTSSQEIAFRGPKLDSNQSLTNDRLDMEQSGCYRLLCLLFLVSILDQQIEKRGRPSPQKTVLERQLPGHVLVFDRTDIMAFSEIYNLTSLEIETSLKKVSCVVMITKIV